MQGVVREQQPTAIYTEAPLWMRIVLNNTAAYADFVVDLKKSRDRVLAQANDFIKEGEVDKAKMMIGKHEMLTELFHIVEAYRKEEANARG